MLLEAVHGKVGFVFIQSLIKFNFRAVARYSSNDCRIPNFVVHTDGSRAIGIAQGAPLRRPAAWQSDMAMEHPLIFSAEADESS